MPKVPPVVWADVSVSVPVPTLATLKITASLKRWKRPEKVVEALL